MLCWKLILKKKINLKKYLQLNQGMNISYRIADWLLPVICAGFLEKMKPRFLWKLYRHGCNLFLHIRQRRVLQTAGRNHKHRCVPIAAGLKVFSFSYVREYFGNGFYLAKIFMFNIIFYHFMYPGAVIRTVYRFNRIAQH